MIEILPNIFAIPVPGDATNIRLRFGRHITMTRPFSYRIESINKEEGSFRLLGTCTKEYIDFDCEGVVETKPYGDCPFFCTIDYRCKPHKNGFRPGFCADTGRQYTDSFRSSLEAAGIDWNVIEKLVIIKKQTTNQ